MVKSPEDAKKEEPLPRPPKLAMQGLVRIVSLLGVGTMVVLWGIAAVIDTHARDSYSSTGGNFSAELILPLFYFGFFFASSFGRWRARTWFFTGLFAHCFILHFAYRCFADGALILGFPILLMAICWIAMWVEAISVVKRKWSN